MKIIDTVAEVPEAELQAAVALTQQGLEESGAEYDDRDAFHDTLGGMLANEGVHVSDAVLTELVQQWY